jgi:hypothetical protein
VAHAVITIDFNYEEGAKGSFTPVVREYTVDNVRSGKSKYAVDVQGLPSAPIFNLPPDELHVRQRRRRQHR